MTVSAADRELVDREFRPGELPVAEPPPSVIEEPAGRPSGGSRVSVAAWLALGSMALIFALIIASSAVRSWRSPTPRLCSATPRTPGRSADASRSG